VELTTTTLVVRGAPEDPPDTTFDYVVNGLRIGFEEAGVVREKVFEAYIPSMNEHRELYQRRPELRQFAALERFKKMRTDVRGPDADSLDLSASQELRAAVHEYDPAVDPPVSGLLGRHPTAQEAGSETTSPRSTASSVAREGVTEQAGFSGIAANERAGAGGETEPPVDPAGSFRVASPVDAGDLLSLDPEHPGLLVRSSSAHDPGIVGIAAGDSLADGGELRVELVGSGYAMLKVDAGYGEIRPGDLLTSSFTAGHAMRATESIPGTIVGKALEALETGTGAIRVLVMPR
jgi:hypothetical protein